MADIIHNSRTETLIALDIAKKHHDALIQLPSGKTGQERERFLSIHD